jgi:hypothetical protein
VLFSIFAWSFAVLPVAAKYRMASVADFLLLETAFTLLQFLLVAPLIALAYRGAATTSVLLDPSRSPSHAVRSSLG